MSVMESKMKFQPGLSEEAMQRMEAGIPELASGAFTRAYYQALTVSGKVLEACNGQLVETTSDGVQRVIRSLAKPMAVKLGTQRVRARKT